MQYRKFGNTGIDVSVLGFGSMRLPVKSVDGKIVQDYEEGIRIIRRAFDLGVNYIDSAPGYCGGESEIIVGQALKGYRDKVYVSTKNPIDNASGDDWMRRLEGSLKKLDIDYIDFYHMWGINLNTYENSINVKNGPLEAARKAKEQGMIKHISFSFHDKVENMVKLVNTGNFDSVLAQYNLLDRSNELGFKAAHEAGMGTVVMGPVAGGRLGEPSKQICDMIPGGSKSTAELALRFVLANPNICCALSGMSTMAQVEENCQVAATSAPLTPEQVLMVNAAMEQNRELAKLYCTGCKYCMPCPQDVNIPRIFEAMNMHRVYGIDGHAKGIYKSIGSNEYNKGKTASACVECGLCEKKCPQKIQIRKQLKECAGFFGY